MPRIHLDAVVPWCAGLLFFLGHCTTVQQEVGAGAKVQSRRVVQYSVLGHLHIDKHTVEGQQKSTNLGDDVVYCLPPLALVLDVRVEVAATEKTVVHDDCAEIILQMASVWPMEVAVCTTYLMFL